MEVGSPTSRIEGSPAQRMLAWARAEPARSATAVLVLVAVTLALLYGPQALAQRTINGVVSGSYFALGAVGLTLVYGTLRLVNFAHGDMLTFGAYVAFLFNVTVGLPIVVAAACAIALTAAPRVAPARVLWGAL